MRPLISFIIPAYRVEEFISECIASLCVDPKILDSVEIIVVDDGSPDDSAAVVAELQKDIPQIVLLRQENKGIGGARNYGVREATGEYIWFVDADDRLDPEWTRIVVPLLRRGDYDAVSVCGLNFDDKGNQTPRENYHGLGQESSGLALLESGRMQFGLPFTIYRRDYLDSIGLTFLEKISHEDIDFTTQSYYRLNKIALVDRPVYQVRVNPDSITRRVNPQRFFDLIEIARHVDDFRKESVEKSHRHTYSRLIALALNIAFDGNSKMDRDIQSRFSEAIGKNRGLLLNYVKSRKIKYICQGLLFLLIPMNAAWVYNHIQKR